MPRVDLQKSIAALIQENHHQLELKPYARTDLAHVINIFHWGTALPRAHSDVLMHTLVVLTAGILNWLDTDEPDPAMAQLAAELEELLNA